MRKVWATMINIDYLKSRPAWADFWLGLATQYAARSHDANTQHSCLLVNSSNQLVVAGYNGFPSGSDDYSLPNDRSDGNPDKYHCMNHAEESAIFQAARNGTSVAGLTAYITGLPCSNCARKLVSVGVTQWICGDKFHSSVLDATEIKWRNVWIVQHRVNLKLVGNNWTEEVVKKLEPRQQNFPGGRDYYWFLSNYTKDKEWQLHHACGNDNE
jgi:dCMP deaminase